MNVFINLAVEDLARSRAFFTALDFSFDEKFCDHQGLGMQISDTVFAMLLLPEKFRQFTPRALAKAKETTEVLTALQYGSREKVDEIMAAALENGGTEVRPAEEHGFMYGRSFADPDGHIWEPFWFDMSTLEEIKA